MPASSVSSLTSWGLYLLASVALLIVAAPMVAGASQAARFGADTRNLDGVRTVFDSLRPGMKVTFAFGGEPGSDSLRIEGHLITCASASGKLVVVSKWELPNMILQPTVDYSVQLEGGSVKVVGLG